MRNEMMHRPVVKKELVAFMREKQKQLTGKLGQIEQAAHEKKFLLFRMRQWCSCNFLLGQMKPKQILEIGTAIGFSSSLMAQYVGDGHVTTIDRYDVMIKKSQRNLQTIGP